MLRSEHPFSSSTGIAPKEELRNEFGGVGWESQDILATLDDVDDLYFDVVSQIRMDRWSRGRVLLIGVAAGCMSLLGGEGLDWRSPRLRDGLRPGRVDANYRRAFDAYEEACVRSSSLSKPVGRFIPFFATRTRFALWFRNAGDAHHELRAPGNSFRR